MALEEEKGVIVGKEKRPRCHGWWKPGLVGVEATVLQF